MMEYKYYKSDLVVIIKRSEYEENYIYTSNIISFNNIYGISYFKK